MKKKDYTKATPKELVEQINILEEELRNLFFQVGANQLKDVRSIRQKRKELARMKTALAQTQR